tara:strand:- start:389 stop:1012 length:624 start_codon:yes stop_codon:yes gene_type:complete
MDLDLIPIRRYVNSDNSCLFTSIGYLIDNKNFDETTSYKYRHLIAEYLLTNYIEEGILGKSKNEYIDEIQDPNKWGGGIELRIFSDIFKIKIGSIDVQTNRIDIYGENKPYPKIIYLLYNGVHYDPLVMNMSSDSNNESDITKFDYTNDNILIKFREYVSKFKQSGDFVDISNLKNFECEICSEKLQTESDALVHAQNTNHWEFKQI